MREFAQPAHGIRPLMLRTISRQLETASTTGAGERSKRIPGDSLLDRVDLPPSSLDLLTAAVLLTGLGVLIVGNVVLGSAAVLLRSLPIAAMSFGVMGLFCAASRILRSTAWGVVVCFGTLLGAVFGPQAYMVPATVVLLVLSVAYILSHLRLSRRDFALALGMAALGTATIALTPNSYTSFDMIGRLYTGDVSVDTLYHASMSSMIKNYGVVSTGLNGLVGTPYHALAHALFAAISLASGAPVIEVYGVAPWVLFAPLLIFAATACSDMQSGGQRTNTAAVWSAVCVLLVLVPPIFGRWALWDSYFTSESYLVCLIIFLLTLPHLWKHTLSNADYLLLLVLTVGVSAAKASVGLVLVGLFALRVLVYGGRSRIFETGILLLLAGAATAVVFDSAVANSNNVALGPLHFIEHYSFLGRHLLAAHVALRTGGSVSWRAWLLAALAVGGFVGIHFWTSWAVLFEAVRRQGTATALRSPNVVYSLGAVAAALVIVFTCRILGGSAYYFSNVAFFVSLAPFAAISVRMFASAKTAARTVLLCVTAIPFLLDARIKWLESAYAPTRQTVPANALITGLLEAAHTVPRAWVLQVDPPSVALNPLNNCRARPFLFPALSERPWVWPALDDSDCSYTDYGYQSYGITPGSHRPTVPLRLPPGGRVVHWSAVPAPP